MKSLSSRTTQQLGSREVLCPPQQPACGRPAWATLVAADTGSQPWPLGKCKSNSSLSEKDMMQETKLAEARKLPQAPQVAKVKKEKVNPANSVKDEKMMDEPTKEEMTKEEPDDEDEDEGGLPENICKLSMAEFLAFKGDLKGKMVAALGPYASGSGKKSEVEELNDLRRRDPELEKDADVEAMGLEEEIAKVREEADKLQKAVQTVSNWRYADAKKQQEWMSMIQAAWSCRAAFLECRDAIKELLQVVKTTCAGKRRAQVLAKRNERYKRDKVAGALASGGHPQALARSLAQSWMENVQAKPWEVDHENDVVQMDEKTQWPFWVKLAEGVKVHYEAIVAVAVGLEEKKKGSSIMKQLDCFDTDFLEMLSQELKGWELEGKLGDGGLKPWLVVSDVHTCLLGFTRCPLQGMASIIVPLSHPVVVGCVPLEDVIDKGSLADGVKSYFEHEEDARCRGVVLQPRMGLCPFWSDCTDYSLEHKGAQRQGGQALGDKHS